MIPPNSIFIVKSYPDEDKVLVNKPPASNSLLLATGGKLKLLSYLHMIYPAVL